MRAEEDKREGVDIPVLKKEEKERKGAGIPLPAGKTASAASGFAGVLGGKVGVAALALGLGGAGLIGYGALESGRVQRAASEPQLPVPDTEVRGAVRDSQGSRSPGYMARARGGEARWGGGCVRARPGRQVLRVRGSGGRGPAQVGGRGRGPADGARRRPRRPPRPSGGRAADGRRTPPRAG
jgi:hypothetical protein